MQRLNKFHNVSLIIVNFDGIVNPMKVLSRHVIGKKSLTILIALTDNA